MTRGNNKNVVFRSDDDYKFYIELIYRYKAEHSFDLYHYCLMPTHTHYEIQTKTAKDFSVFMKKINLSYFHYYRKKYGWVGHFWQDRFKSQPVGKDDYFIQCGKYIELNPVRKGLVSKPEDWLYSSYLFYAQGKPSDLITEDFIYIKLGNNNAERQKNYSRLLIDQSIKKSYQENTWGSIYQRFREKEKISRKQNRKRNSKKRD
jgi:putative transposase